MVLNIINKVCALNFRNLNFKLRSYPILFFILTNIFPDNLVQTVLPVANTTTLFFKLTIIYPLFSD